MAKYILTSGHAEQGKAAKIIEARKEHFQVGGVYLLRIKLPVCVGSDNYDAQFVRCRCEFKNDHWALFSYTSPKSGVTCRRGFRWLDIEEHSDPDDEKLAEYREELYIEEGGTIPAEKRETR